MFETEVGYFCENVNPLKLLKHRKFSCSSRIRLRWTGYIIRMGETRHAYVVFMGGASRKGPLEGLRRIYEDN
jgi:hypothetical protein